MATLDQITERIRAAVADGAGLQQRLKFDLKGEGFVHIDGTTVVNDDLPADLVITISRKDLEALGKRELDPMRAIMTGRMKLSDMGLAMKLQPAIQTLFAKAV
jgi:putative sterol carrier protein